MKNYKEEELTSDQPGFLEFDDSVDGPGCPSVGEGKYPYACTRKDDGHKIHAAHVWRGRLQVATWEDD